MVRIGQRRLAAAVAVRRNRRCHGDADHGEARVEKLAMVDDCQFLHPSLLGERRSSVGSESNTETVDSRGDSEMDEDAAVEVPDTVEEAEVEIGGPRGANYRAALESLDDVDPQRNVEKRASVMKSIPKFLRGPSKMR